MLADIVFQNVDTNIDSDDCRRIVRAEGFNLACECPIYAESKLK